MKILELTDYSAGGCGVFARVRQEAGLLSKEGHEVRIFSSNLEKGTNKEMPLQDNSGKIKIMRFKARKLGGESFMSWKFEKEALEFRPDVIIAHSYRHPHTTRALKIKHKLGCKVFLVTHAPFIEKNITRSFPAKISVKFYDSFIGKKIINKFDKVISITKWEIPHLLKLGINKDKIVYVPNGIPDEFFTISLLAKEENKILFLGRISPIKNLEVLIMAFSEIINKETKLEIVGPAENKYLNLLKNLVKDLRLRKRVIFSPPIYDNKIKIKKIDSSRVFVLPSKREAMPQSLIEAMARRKICIASNNPGSNEIIADGKNGMIFANNKESLTHKLNLALSKKSNLKQMGDLAKASVENFKWSKVIKEFKRAINDDKRNNNFV